VPRTASIDRGEGDARGLTSSDRHALWRNCAQESGRAVDADIERILDVYQSKYQTTRDKANAELVRRLSSLGGAEPCSAWHTQCL
jgi:hypothetical protein